MCTFRAISLLWSFLLLCHLVHHTLQEHICKHIHSGNLAQIDLKSFSHTFDRGRHGSLLMFESDQVYVIDRTTIKSTSLPLPEKHEQWNKSYPTLRGITPPEGTNRIKTITLLANHTLGVEQMVLLTDQMEIFVEKRGIIRNSITRMHPDYSLVLNEYTHGYVLHQDLSGATKDELVIYDFTYEVEHRSHRVKFNIEMTNQQVTPSNRAFFYLDKNVPEANLLRFIHRMHRKEQANNWGPLIASQPSPPPGFIYNNWVYLFEQSLGCVHTFPYTSLRRYAESQTSFAYKRTSYPYELFFGCTSEGKPMTSTAWLKLDMKRCDKNVMQQPSPPAELRNDSIGDKQLATDNHMSYAWLISAVLFVGIVVGGLAFMFCTRTEAEEDLQPTSPRRRKDKKNKKNKKKKKKRSKKKKKKRSKSLDTSIPAVDETEHYDEYLYN